MKQLVYIIFFIVGMTVFTVQAFDSQDMIEMVVPLPELESREMQKNLEVDINRMPGVKFVEPSLSSQTLILNYDPQKVSKESIENILEKWNCDPGEFSFRNVISMK